METLLNPDYISRANSASHFDTGDSIEREAHGMLAKFDIEFHLVSVGSSRLLNQHR